MTRTQLAGTDLQVSPLCCGLGGFGTSIKGDDAQRLLDLFIELNGNFFDTAHCYAFWVPDSLGESERTLGECVRRHGRKNIVIGTKGGHPSAPGYVRPEAYLSDQVIASDLDESLDRLGVDTVDLYWLHRDDTRVPVGEIIDMLNGEMRRGRVRFAGASNWSPMRIEQANAYAKANGLRGFIASQPQWTLASPNPSADPTMRFLIEEDRAWHETSQLPVVCYTPTAGGYFSTGGATGAIAFDNPISRARLERVQQLATELHATPNQIALAYLMNQKFQAIPITGTTQPTHLQDAITATDLFLTPEQTKWLEGDSPKFEQAQQAERDVKREVELPGH